MAAPSPPIYLDHAATTPCDPRVVDRMLPFFRQAFGNPASRAHAFGWAAAAAVEHAREQVAALLGGEPQEVVFTSGATEANNLALKGVVATYAAKGRHVIACVTEHPSVLDPLRSMESAGHCEVTWLGVDDRGRVDLDALRAAITERTVLITLMAANNEIGTLHPLREVGALAKQSGVLFHTDATQAAGKVPLDVQALGLDLLSLSAHKLYGPKGSGCLWVRRRAPRVALAPLLHGGGHERGMRSGTLNVPGIVGLGEACAIAAGEMAGDAERTVALRDRLERAVIDGLAGASAVTVNGDRDVRLPHLSNLTFPGIAADPLLAALGGRVALSTGSACSSVRQEPSHVLLAIGRSPEAARCSVRVSLGRWTTGDEVDAAAAAIVAAARRVVAAGRTGPGTR